MGITSAGDDPETARRAVEFLLSQPAQQFLVDETAEYPVVGGVQPTRADVDLASLDSLSPPDVELAQLSSLSVTEKLLQEVGLL